METAVALALFASLIIACWVAYVRSGARRWTTERDPLGEPPVRMAAVVAVIVVAVALVSTGGGGAEHPGSTQQGLDDGDAAFAASDAAGAGVREPAGTAAANVVAAAAPNTAASAAKSAVASRSQQSGAASRSAGARVTATGEADSADGRSYAELVDEAHDASERRGAIITWYPAIVRKAERAAAQRNR